MGDPRKKRKLYEKPKRLWDVQRIEAEKALREEFGLKNARELWRMQTLLRKIRREARRMLSGKGKGVEERSRKLLNRVKKFLIKKPDVTLDDILALTTQDILSRRLQTVVYGKHLAKTVNQARQFIVHGHIAINGCKVTAPSYLTKFDEESEVGWFKKPVLTEKLPKPEEDEDEKSEEAEEEVKEEEEEKPKEEEKRKKKKKSPEKVKEEKKEGESREEKK